MHSPSKATIVSYKAEQDCWLVSNQVLGVSSSFNRDRGLFDWARLHLGQPEQLALNPTSG